MTIPFSAGKTWRYSADEETRAFGGVYSFAGERLLYAEKELTWQGRTAWKVSEIDEQHDGSAKFGFEVSTHYFAQGAEGLDLWIGTATDGEWMRLLSRESLTFTNNVFLWAGDVESNRATTINLQVPVTVPAGNFSTAEAGVEYDDSDGGSGPSDIFERHHEYYADGVGLVRATWNVSFDDNLGNGDYHSNGIVDLLSVDGSEVRREVEPNDSAAQAAAALLPPGGYLLAETQLGDAGSDTTDANVQPNYSGARQLQDFYRLTVATPGQYLVTLVDNSAWESGASRTDLDLYLFREGAAGALTYVDSSVQDPSRNPGGEQIDLTLAAGTYFIAVQAWNTPVGAAQYWLSVR